MLYIYSVLAYLENLWVCLILFWLYLISISIINRILTPSEESAFTARPKINLKSQIFRCDQSIFCLPNLPIFSDFFDLCLLRSWNKPLHKFTCNFIKVLASLWSGGMHVKGESKRRSQSIRQCPAFTGREGLSATG